MIDQINTQIKVNFVLFFFAGQDSYQQCLVNCPICASFSSLHKYVSLNKSPIKIFYFLHPTLTNHTFAKFTYSRIPNKHSNTTCWEQRRQEKNPANLPFMGQTGKSQSTESLGGMGIACNLNHTCTCTRCILSTTV